LHYGRGDPDWRVGSFSCLFRIAADVAIALVVVPLHGTDELAVKVDRFRTGRVERTQMGRVALWIEIGARIACSFLRVAQRIWMLGREQHRMHWCMSVIPSKISYFNSFPNVLFQYLSNVLF
jgi:hypothetical protein